MNRIYVASYEALEKGIRLLDFHHEKLDFEFEGVKGTRDIPSYLTTDGNRLYSCYKNGGIEIFEKDQELTSVAKTEILGKRYVHLAVFGQYIAAADYHGGFVDLFSFYGNALTLMDSMAHQGRGPHPTRQTQPHMHFVGFTPDGKYLYGIDLGADKIRFYDFKGWKLKELGGKSVEIEGGSGPRHGIFSKEGRFFYLVNELVNTVMAFRYDDGDFHLLQTLSTLPAACEIQSTAGAIRLSQSGKSLLVSNRFCDGLAYFTVNTDTGHLKLREIVAAGRHPRDFNILDDKFVILGAMEGDQVQLFLLDEENETLERKPATVSICKPVSIEFH